MSVMQDMGARAMALGIPLSVQLDLTYRCNERCIHCYLDHEDHGEMTTAEILGLLDQLAAAGVFFLNVSGGEIFMRPDLFTIIEHARKLQFSVKLKTNGVMIREAKASASPSWASKRCRSACTRTTPPPTTRSPSCPARSSAPSKARSSCAMPGSR
jgi:hypothetical protein